VSAPAHYHGPVAFTVTYTPITRPDRNIGLSLARNQLKKQGQAGPRNYWIKSDWSKATFRLHSFSQKSNSVSITKTMQQIVKCFGKMQAKTAEYKSDN